MALGTNQITTTTAANFIPEIWSREVRLATESNLVFAKRVFRLDFEVADYGDTIHVPDVSNIIASTKGANTEVVFNTVAETMTNVLINQHVYAAFMLEDIVKTQSKYDLRKYYTQKCGYAVRRNIDTNLATLVASLSQTVGSADADIGDADIISAVALVDDADAPDEDRSIILKPSQHGALLRIDKFIRMDYVPNRGQAVQKGKIGEIYGAEVFKTTNVYTSGITRYNCYMHKEAFVLAMQKEPRTQAQYFVNWLGWAVVVDTLYGSLEYRDDHGVALLSR